MLRFDGLGGIFFRWTRIQTARELGTPWTSASRSTVAAAREAVSGADDIESSFTTPSTTIVSHVLSRASSGGKMCIT